MMKAFTITLKVTESDRVQNVKSCHYKLRALLCQRFAMFAVDQGGNTGADFCE